MSTEVNPLVWVGVILVALCLLGFEFVRQRTSPRTTSDSARERTVRRGLAYSQIASASLFGVLLAVVSIIGVVNGAPGVFAFGLLGAIAAAGVVRYIYVTLLRSD